MLFLLKLLMSYIFQSLYTIKIILKSVLYPIGNLSLIASEPVYWIELSESTVYTELP